MEKKKFPKPVVSLVDYKSWREFAISKAPFSREKIGYPFPLNRKLDKKGRYPLNWNTFDTVHPI